MSKKLYDEVAATAGRLGVDPNLATALARAESGGNPNAVSPKGARGTMQVMPATLADLEARHGRKMSNIEAGTTYLREMLDTFGDEEKAVAAYNTGPGNVKKAIESATAAGNPDAWRDHLPAQETRDYLTRVASYRGQGEPVATSETPAGIPGINSVEDLKKLPGWDKLSRDAKLQALNRAGLGDFSSMPPNIFDQVMQSDEAAGMGFGALGREGGGVGGTSVSPIPQPIEDAFRARFVDPVRDLFSPGTSRLDRVLAAAEVGSTLYPPAAIAAGAGAVVTGLTSWWSGDPTLSGLLGAAVEMASGVGALSRPARRGKRILNEAREGMAREAAAGLPEGLRAAERLGASAKTDLRKLIKRGKELYGPQLDQVITEAHNLGLTLPTTHPEYNRLIDILTGFNEGQFMGVPQDIAQMLSGLEQAMREGRAIPVRDLREAHNRIRNWTKYVDEFNPNAKTMLHFADRAGDALNHATAAGLESVPRLRERFRGAQQGWHNLVGEPERVLKNVLMPTVSPQQAFNRLFNLSDPQKLRMAGTLIRQYADEPSRLKLRLGFLQMVSDKTNEFTNPTAVMGFLREHEAVLTQARLFTRDELRDITHLMRKYSITTMRNILEQGVKAKMGPATMIGAAGAAGAATAIGSGAFTRNPETGRWDYDARGILLAALATAGAPYLIRAMVNPRDSKASRAALSRIVGGATAGLRAIFAGEQTFANEDGIPEPGGS